MKIRSHLALLTLVAILAVALPAAGQTPMKLRLGVHTLSLIHI